MMPNEVLLEYSLMLVNTFLWTIINILYAFFLVFQLYRKENSAPFTRRKAYFTARQ